MSSGAPALYYHYIESSGQRDMFAGPCNMLQKVGFSPSLSKMSVKYLPHTEKKNLVNVCRGLDQPLVVKRHISPLWEAEGKVKCLYNDYT